MCVCYTDRICVRKRLSFGADFVASEFPAPAWRNWQTRWTQNPVIARSCGFEPLRRQILGHWGSTLPARAQINPAGTKRDITFQMTIFSTASYEISERYGELSRDRVS